MDSSGMSSGGATFRSPPNRCGPPARPALGSSPPPAPSWSQSAWDQSPVRCPDDQKEAIMKDDSGNPGHVGAPGLPAAVDRAAFQAELDRLRVREKAHTREGDAIAAARRRLPMTEVDASTRADRARRAAHLARHVRGTPAAHRLLLHVEPRPPRARAVRRLHVLHEPDHGAVLPALPRHHLRGLPQGRNVASGEADSRASYRESLRYRDFMGWDVPWYSAQPSLDALLADREIGLFHLVCYLRDGAKYSRPTGRNAVVWRPWTIATRSWTSPSTAPGELGGLARGLAATVLQRAN